MLQALKPTVRVLQLVDGDGSTVGYLFEAMEKAKEAIRQLCGDDQDKYLQLWNLFEERHENNIIHPIHAAAAFLNPAYMCNDNFREDHEMKELLVLCQRTCLLLRKKKILWFNCDCTE